MICIGLVFAFAAIAAPPPPPPRPLPPGINVDDPSDAFRLIGIECLSVAEVAFGRTGGPADLC